MAKDGVICITAKLRQNLAACVSRILPVCLRLNHWAHSFKWLISTACITEAIGFFFNLMLVSTFIEFQSNALLIEQLPDKSMHDSALSFSHAFLSASPNTKEE